MSELLYKAKNAYDVFSEQEITQAYQYCEGYKQFIDNGKVDRKSTRLNSSHSAKSRMPSSA